MDTANITISRTYAWNNPVNIYISRGPASDIDIRLIDDGPVATPANLDERDSSMRVAFAEKIEQLLSQEGDGGWAVYPSPLHDEAEMLYLTVTCDLGIVRHIGLNAPIAAEADPMAYVRDQMKSVLDSLSR
ncbi:hypothetical protein L6172_09910 [Thalassospiraceae bacterium SW-3-3]|nr:hypothetical protein L6172_09910 [Thalassospiraceae bacterium SW-3-3]